MKKNAKSSKVRKQTNVREKMTYMKKNWQLYLFFLMPGAFTDNYF